MRDERTHIAEDLGINLSSRTEDELFKWFLARLHFGKPIQLQVAEKAFGALFAAGLTSPYAMLRAGWDELVRLPDEAHYVRLDFSTATKLLHVSEELRQPHGTLSNLLSKSRTPGELSARLQESSILAPRLS